MRPIDATKERYELVTVCGVKGIFNDMRLDRKTIPEGLHVYEVRHDDEGWGDPVELADGIMVNFFGTLITKEEILLEQSTYTANRYRWLEDEDWNYEGIGLSIDEFIKGE